MTIEIWDRRTAGGETRTVVVVGGTGTELASPEAAIEFLRGKVRELQASVETAVGMYERTRHRLAKLEALERNEG